jgi:hypothetical protein
LHTCCGTDPAARYGQSWWQEVSLILLALGNPSLFVRFMREVVKGPTFAQMPELLDLLLEEAAEVSPVPFTELAGAQPGRDAEVWKRQLLALRVRAPAGALQLGNNIRPTGIGAGGTSGA